MSDLGKIQGEVSLDTTDADQALARVEGNAKKMARGVTKAGSDAAAGVKQVGAGVKEAADQVTRQESRMTAALKRTIFEMDNLGKSASQRFEAKMQLQGLDASKFQPYLDKLREAERAQQIAMNGMGKMQISAAQTAAAMRGVPAQMTDIIVSLQGGMNPMTVLLQQGGQLKDMFGGVVPAAKALGSQVLGLVNPFTLAAAAAVATYIAYEQTRKEASALDLALVKTGNSIGATSSELRQMASALEDRGFNRGAAVTALAQVAESGVVARDSLVQFTATALDMEKYGGQAVDKTVDAFKRLRAEPAKAAQELSASLHFLTLAQLEQITALEKQGSKTDAARVAQQAYADAVKPAIDAYKANLGPLETALTYWTKKGSQMWAALRGEGETGESRLAKAREQLASLEQRRNMGFSSAAPGGLQAQIDAQREQVTYLERTNKAAKDNARFEAERQHVQEQAVGVLGLVSAAQDRGLSKQQQMNKALQEYRENLDKIRAANPASPLLDPAKVAMGEDSIREGFKETEKRKKVDEPTQSYDQLVKRLQGDLVQAAAQAEGAQRSYNNAQTEFLAVAASGDWQKWNDQQRMGIAALYEKAIAQEEATDAAKKDAEMIAYANKTLTDLYDKAVQIGDNMKAQVEAAKAENELIGLTGPALWELREARMMEAAAQYEQRAAMIAGTPGREAEAQQMRQTADEIRKLAAERTAGARKQAEVDAAKTEQQKAEAAIKGFNDFLDPSKAQDFGSALSDAFGAAGSSLGKLTNALQAYGRKQAQIAEQRNVLPYFKDEEERAKEAQRLNAYAAKEQIGHYADITGAAKGFFSEHSKGYQAVAAAEKAFRVAELAMSLQTGLVKAKEAIVTQASGGDPYTAFARMATMTAAMAALGFVVSGAGSGASTSAAREERQRTQGTGTVFGDPDAKSNSLGNAFDMLEDSAKLELRYQSGMLASLRNIESSMAGVANAVLRTQGITSGNSLGVFEGVLSTNKGDPILNAIGLGGLDFAAKLPGIGGVIGKLQSLWGKTKQEITDSGLVINGVVADLSKGIGFSQYTDVTTTKSSFFGLSKSSKSRTIFGDLDEDTNEALGRVFTGLSNALQSASGALGLSADAVSKQIAETLIDIPRVSLRDLKGDDLKDAISSTLSAAADTMAEGLIPGLKDFQRVGEGYFETIVRVSTGIESADYALERFGLTAVGYADIIDKQGDVAAEIFRDSVSKFEGAGSGMAEIIRGISGTVDDLSDTYTGLIAVRNSLKSVGANGSDPTFDLLRGAGGLEGLQDGLDSYLEGFFNETERYTAASARLAEQFASIGTPQPQTIEAFRALASSLDLNDAASAQLFGRLMNIADAFYDVATAVEESEARLKSAFDDVAADWLGGEELRAYRASRISEGLAETGLSISPEALLGLSTESFKALYAAIDKTTMLGREQATALLNAWGSFKDMNAEMEAAEKAKADARRREAEAAQSVAAQLQAAAQRVRDAWSSAIDSVVEEVKRIRGEMTGNGPEGFSAAQSQFAIATAAARAGDIEATKSLPTLSRQVLELAKQNASSAMDLKAFQAQIAASLIETSTHAARRAGVAVPAFAAGGNHAGGLALVGEKGPELVNLPPSRIFSNSQSTNMLADLAAEIKALREENRAVAGELARLQLRTAKATEGTNRILDRVTEGGEAVRTTT